MNKIQVLEVGGANSEGGGGRNLGHGPSLLELSEVSGGRVVANEQDRKAGGEGNHCRDDTDRAPGLSDDGYDET
jgi:hypothetical protein